MQVAPVIGVVSGVVDHGQYFAGLHVEHHQAAGLGAEFGEGIAQFAVGQVLQTQVDRQRQGLTSLGVLRYLHVLDQSTTAILEHLTLARHTAEPIIKRQFHALTAVVVDIGKADHVGRDLTRGVETAKLFDGVDTRHLEVEHGLALLRGQATHQVHKLTLGILFQALGKGFRLLPQGSGQRRPLATPGLQFFAIGPQRGDRGADRQRLAIAVGNQAAVRGNRNMSHAAGIALALQEVVINHLQVDDAPDNRPGHQRQQHQHQTETPGIERAFQFHHGATICTSAASGMRICRRSVAMVSMRLWAVQVLCSRIRRPHSACALSRTLSSAYKLLSNWRFQWAL